jgi:hypothetical protein
MTMWRSAPHAFSPSRSAMTFFFDWPRSRERAATSDGRQHYRGASRTRRHLDRRAPAAPWRTYYAAGRPCTLLIEEIETIWDAIAGATTVASSFSPPHRAGRRRWRPRSERCSSQVTAPLMQAQQERGMIGSNFARSPASIAAVI